MNQWKTHPYLLLLSVDGVKSVARNAEGVQFSVQGIESGQEQA
jgi:hypothetical protein